MLTKLSKNLKNYANGWPVSGLLAGELFFNAVILPAQQAKIEAGSGGSARLTCNSFRLLIKSMR